MEKIGTTHLTDREGFSKLQVIDDDKSVLLVAINAIGTTWYFYDLNVVSSRCVAQIDTTDANTVERILQTLYQERVENKEPIAARDGNNDGSNKTPMT